MYRPRHKARFTVQHSEGLTLIAEAVIWGVLFTALFKLLISR